MSPVRDFIEVLESERQEGSSPASRRRRTVRTPPPQPIIASTFRRYIPSTRRENAITGEVDTYNASDYDHMFLEDWGEGRSSLQFTRYIEESLLWMMDYGNMSRAEVAARYRCMLVKPFAEEGFGGAPDGARMCEWALQLRGHEWRAFLPRTHRHHRVSEPGRFYAELEQRWVGGHAILEETPEAQIALWTMRRASMVTEEFGRNRSFSAREVTMRLNTADAAGHFSSPSTRVPSSIRTSSTTTLGEPEARGSSREPLRNNAFAEAPATTTTTTTTTTTVPPPTIAAALSFTEVSSPNRLAELERRQAREDEDETRRYLNVPLATILEEFEMTVASPVNEPGKLKKKIRKLVITQKKSFLYLKFFLHSLFISLVFFFFLLRRRFTAFSKPGHYATSR